MCVIGSIFREGGLDDLRESSLGKVCTRAAVPDRKRLLSFFDSMPAARKARMCPGVFAWRPNLREQRRVRARSSGDRPRNTSIRPGGVVTHPSLHGVPNLSPKSKAGQRTLSLHIYTGQWTLIGAGGAAMVPPPHAKWRMCGSPVPVGA